MIKKITTYPTQTGFEFGGTVRHFDETLTQLLTDLKDTIEANNLEGLAAFQIGSPLTVIVIKKENEFLEIINPAIFTKEGEITPTESTAYFPNLTATTSRAAKIKLMYENAQGEQQFLTAENELAVLIQRKVDYLMGSSFLVRLSSEEKELFEKKLESNSDELTLESCPTGLKSEKILNGIKYGLIMGVIAVIVALFMEDNQFIKTAEYYLLALLSLMTIGYFFYAQYEGKSYRTCTSCQIGNILAMSVIKSIHIAGLGLLVYFLL